jgi:hypothetical protein
MKMGWKVSKPNPLLSYSAHSVSSNRDNGILSQ